MYEWGKVKKVRRNKTGITSYSWTVCVKWEFAKKSIAESQLQKIFTSLLTLTTVYNNTKLLLTFIISLIRENLSKIFLTSLDRIYLLWRVTRVDRDIWNHKILHELLNLISLTNKGSHLVIFFRTVFPLIRPGGIPFLFHFYS